jgi:choline dehydrogenase-like flavoprotein
VFPFEGCRLDQGARGVGDSLHAGHLRAGHFKGGQIDELEETPGLSAGAWEMRPLSRGYVEAKSNQPEDMPAINPRYLSEESDRRAIIGGLRMARRIFAAPALKPFVREESLPACRYRTTANCSTTRGATAASAITPAAPA